MKLKHTFFLILIILLFSKISAKEILFRAKANIGKNQLKGSEIDESDKLNYLPRSTDFNETKIIEGSEREEPEPILDTKDEKNETNESLKSLDYYFGIKQQLEELRYEKTLFYATTLRKIGLSYQRKGKFDEAYENYNISEETFKRSRYYESEYHKKLYYNIFSLYEDGFKKPCKGLLWLKKANILEKDSIKLNSNSSKIKSIENKCSGKES